MMQENKPVWNDYTLVNLIEECLSHAYISIAKLTTCFSTSHNDIRYFLLFLFLQTYKNI